ncbi:MAG: hypothetical protein WAP03_13235 [Methylorubrum rhodinum]|uniref:hypothetical protein n=1 Tax=Methylorubrum rhodinum TaxID=29428 RepID=UPI003BAE9C4F
MYDRVKQLFPGAPCALGARVRRTTDARVGTIAPPRPGVAGVCVRFDGSFPPVDVPPSELEYLKAPVVALAGSAR